MHLYSLFLRACQIPIFSGRAAEIGPADSSAILMKHCVKPHRDRQSERVTDSETRGLPESGDQSQGRSARILEVATGNTTGSSSSGSTMEDSSRESPQVLPEAKKLEGGSRKRQVYFLYQIPGYKNVPYSSDILGHLKQLDSGRHVIS